MSGNLQKKLRKCIRERIIEYKDDDFIKLMLGFRLWIRVIFAFGILFKREKWTKIYINRTITLVK